MAQADSTARKAPAEVTPLYRTAPHNIEAEQALLGAILLNNEAFFRLSRAAPFLRAGAPEHL
jgi:replicative DNA helicase